MSICYAIGRPHFMCSRRLLLVRLFLGDILDAFIATHWSRLCLSDTLYLQKYWFIYFHSTVSDIVASGIRCGIGGSVVPLIMVIQRGDCTVYHNHTDRSIRRVKVRIET
jgi:hypothetical protein